MKSRSICAFLASVVASVPANTSAVVRFFEDSGANPADITDTVTEFRNALGTLNPNTPGSFLGGRREINWDGVPDTFSSPNNLPANFFNVNSPRGAVFSTAGNGFQVSMDDDNPADADPDLVEFAN